MDGRKRKRKPYGRGEACETLRRPVKTKAAKVSFMIEREWTDEAKVALRRQGKKNAVVSYNRRFVSPLYMERNEGLCCRK